MNKCIKCGKEAIYAKSYFIGNRSVISIWALKGAAVVGICGECAKPNVKSMLNNKILLALLIFFVLLVISIAVIVIGSEAGIKATGNDLLIFLIIGICMVACIKKVFGYSASIKTLESNDVEIMKELINDKMIAKTIGRNQIISENIIFNWDVLNTKRGAVSADFTQKAFISEIRTPFESNKNGMLILEGLMDVSIETLVKPPKSIIHKGLDEEGKELIRQACECYQKEENGWYQFANNQNHVIIQSLL